MTSRKEKALHNSVIRTFLNKVCYISLLFLNVNLLGQNSTSAISLDSVISNYQIVYAKPVDKLELETLLPKWSLRTLPVTIREVFDSTIFNQIIRNGTRLDTTPWDDEELKKAILITNDSTPINRKRALKKFSALTKNERKDLKKLINSYNASLNAGQRPKILNYYSRPVYDDSGHFAVIQHDHPYSGRISLYQLSNGRWSCLGYITGWVY